MNGRRRSPIAEFEDRVAAGKIERPKLEPDEKPIWWDRPVVTPRAASTERTGKTAVFPPAGNPSI